MAYFEHFPQTTFLNQSITNLATAFKLNDLVKNNTFSMLNYVVDVHDKPDHVAFNYYDDSSYAWLVLLSNQILDPYFQWPLNTNEFNDWIKKKYGSIAAAQAINMHCEHNSKNITLSADSLEVSSGASSGDYSNIDAYTYWDRINDNRRNIKLVNKAHLTDINRQLKTSLDNR
jgi:hypothetical protein